MLAIRLFLKRIHGFLANLWDDICDNLSNRQQPYQTDTNLSSIVFQNLGSGDGRWGLATEKLDDSSIIYSVGVGHDISFDIDLIEKFNCEVHAFDPTIRSKNWLKKQSLPTNFYFHDIGLANYSGYAEFNLPPGHSVSYSMAKSFEGNQTHTADVKTLNDIMDELGHKRISLLKIDIEGGEYDVIDDVANKAMSIDQLLIEFHDRLIGEAASEQALAVLFSSGFKLTAISRRGLEYSLIGPNYFKPDQG